MTKPTCVVPECGKSGHGRGYCSMHYRRLESWGSLDSPPPATCKACGSAFQSKRTMGQLFCSPGCRKLFHGSDSPIKLCTDPDCLRPMRARGLCSMHWKRADRQERGPQSEPWTERRKVNHQKRRAQKMQLPADPILSADVYERDGWVCGLCDLSVDGSLAYPEPFSASLDHIIPLSKGGHHTLDNVQLAHLQCNVRKGALVSA